MKVKSCLKYLSKLIELSLMAYYWENWEKESATFKGKYLQRNARAITYSMIIHEESRNVNGTLPWTGIKYASFLFHSFYL